ncbi:hypothetical protein OG612_15200 [Streptomyces sp. NBC_01527]|uniref:hypothetical protein n=1 Tax=Streptomyces sp. NBC_01527 TaxID=2903894 RepID=UPI00386D9B15
MRSRVGVVSGSVRAGRLRVARHHGAHRCVMGVVAVVRLAGAQAEQADVRIDALRVGTRRRPGGP